MRKPLAITAALILALSLAGCSSGPSQEQLDCEASGGSWEVDYMMPITTYVKSGSVYVPITNYIPIYGCEEPR